MGGDERFHILSVVAGSATILSGGVDEQLTLGQTLLLPASAGLCHLTAGTGTILLDSYLP